MCCLNPVFEIISQKSSCHIPNAIQCMLNIIQQKANLLPSLKKKSVFAAYKITVSLRPHVLYYLDGRKRPACLTAVPVSITEPLELTMLYEREKSSCIHLCKLAVLCSSIYNHWRAGLCDFTMWSDIVLFSLFTCTVTFTADASTWREAASLWDVCLGFESRGRLTFWWAFRYL